MSEAEKRAMSPLCQAFSSGADTLQVNIYKSKKTGWILEMSDQYGNTTVWDDAFDTDESALEEANATIQAEGIASLIGPTDGSWNP